MVSVNGKNYETRIATILADVAHDGTRRLIQSFLDERRANGLRPGTLAANANGLRGFTEHLGDRRFEDAAKADVVAYVNNPRRVRVWRNRNKAGEVTETRREVGRSAATLAERKATIKAFYKWLLGDDEEYPP